MAMKTYLRPENAGNQLWQMLASNLTPGNHPYNFDGLCMALVSQWLMEIKFANGRTPEELGRYLLQEWLGTHGYGGLASSQQIYGSHAPLVNNHTAMVGRHSGGALTRANQVTVHSHGAHWQEIRSRLYGINDDLVHFDAQARVYSAHLSLCGNNSWLLSWIAGATWGHAIGLHSDGTHVYFFDPNYGVFIFNEGHMGTISLFVKAMWDDYSATSGRVADVT